MTSQSSKKQDIPYSPPGGLSGMNTAMATTNGKLAFYRHVSKPEVIRYRQNF